MNSPYMKQTYYEVWAGGDGTGVDVLNYKPLGVGSVETALPNIDKKLLFDPSQKPQIAKSAYPKAPAVSAEKQRELAAILTLPKSSRIQLTGTLKKSSSTTIEPQTAEVDAQSDYTKKDVQISLIQHSFNAMNSKSVIGIKHPTNPGLKPMELLPIYPDWLYWGVEECLVHYKDGDPLSSVSISAPPEDKLSRSEMNEILRKESVLKVCPNKFRKRDKLYVYCTPTGDSAVELADGKEKGEDYEYLAVKEYEQDGVDGKNDRNVIVRIAEKEGVYYSNVSQRLILKKKRAQSRNDYMSNDEIYPTKPSKITAKYRKKNASEQKERRERWSQINVPEKEIQWLLESSDEE
ncbi:hypothetical protein HK098_004977 [Nowakowskiella sp. JEL0407]|nr:hypothetical protein HK098_004977 [Nowakowskiella sp. JEL0407]